jgi:hypothetical protein
MPRNLTGRYRSKGELQTPISGLMDSAVVLLAIAMMWGVAYVGRC